MRKKTKSLKGSWGAGWFALGIVTGGVGLFLSAVVSNQLSPMLFQKLKGQNAPLKLQTQHIAVTATNPPNRPIEVILGEDELHPKYWPWEQTNSAFSIFLTEGTDYYILLNNAVECRNTKDKRENFKRVSYNYSMAALHRMTGDLRIVTEPISIFHVNITETPGSSTFIVCTFKAPVENWSASFTRHRIKFRYLDEVPNEALQYGGLAKSSKLDLRIQSSVLDASSAEFSPSQGVPYKSDEGAVLLYDRNGGTLEWTSESRSNIKDILLVLIGTLLGMSLTAFVEGIRQFGRLASTDVQSLENLT